MDKKKATSTSEDHAANLCICRGLLGDWLRRLLEFLEPQVEGRSPGGDGWGGSRRAHPESRAALQRRWPLSAASFSDGVIDSTERADIPPEMSMRYETKSLIGIGTTSRVFLCVRRRTGLKYACKVIDKRRLNFDFDDSTREQLMDQLRKEVSILQSMDHPGIVKFEDVVETSRAIYLVMELVPGGELLDYLLENGAMQEEAASFLMQGVMSSVAYMHSKGIVHRDIKAENLLLMGGAFGRFPQAKLIDFGLSTQLRNHVYTTKSYLGTGGYMAPEIREEKDYGPSVDVWACGVLIFLINSCKMPFETEVDCIHHHADAFRKYVLHFPADQWEHRTDSLKHLIQQMLHIDPLRRWSAQQVLRHPWITGEAFQKNPVVLRLQAPPNGAVGLSPRAKLANTPMGKRASLPDLQAVEEAKRSLSLTPLVMHENGVGDLITSTSVSLARWGGDDSRRKRYNLLARSR